MPTLPQSLMVRHHMRSDRRGILLAVLWLSGSGVLAQAPMGVEQFKPYLQVKPVAGEESTVRVFFSPACQYSRSYLHFFKNLEATLPNGKKFLLTPLVNKGDGIGYAMAFVAVQRFYPAFVQNFLEASFVGVQDKGISTSGWAGIERIGRAAGVPVSIAKLVADKMIYVKRDVEGLVRVRNDLRVTNTPAVAVAGTYIITPEFTNGDVQLFSQLVNSVISMAR